MIIPGQHWFSSHRCDPRAFALYKRHYSAAKNAPYRKSNSTNFVGSVEHMVLLTADCQALWVWTYPRPEFRDDGEVGINCAVFRREGGALASDLVREADEIACARWPQERHWTYVNPSKTRRKRDPGRCFLKAGWQYARNTDGTRRTSKGGLLILEWFPEPCCADKANGLICGCSTRRTDRPYPFWADAA